MKTAWNTYYPWALALFTTVSVMIAIIIVASWIPAQGDPGVPTSARSGSVVPGLAGILFFVMAGRQMYLRSQERPRKEG
jgi:hypothetical protein